MKNNIIHNRLFSFILFISLIFSFGCSEGNDGKGHIGGGNGSGGETEPPIVNGDTVLVFQSGFEGYTRIIPYGESTNDDISGYDPDLPYSDWNDLKQNEINLIYFNYAGGDESKRHVKIIDDPTNPGNNKVLHYRAGDYWLNSGEGEEKTRIQLELYRIKGGYKEFFQSVRVYLTDDFNYLKKWQKSFNWLTIAEFWNNESWEKEYGFRISVGIWKEAGANKDLYFSVGAEDVGFKAVWHVNNDQVKVPVEKWFTINYHYKEGNKDTGRFYMSIKPDGEAEQVVCDVYDFTHNTQDPNPDGVTAYNPLKLYTSKELITFMKSQDKALQIYWDDFKLWKRPPQTPDKK